MGSQYSCCFILYGHIRVLHRWRICVIPFHYCSLRWVHSNGLPRNPNKDHIQNVCPWEADIPTYQTYQRTSFGVHKTAGISYSRVMFKINCILRHGVVPFYYVLHINTFLIISRVTQTKIMFKIYGPGKLMRQLTSLGLNKLLAFQLVGLYFGYNIV